MSAKAYFHQVNDAMKRVAQQEDQIAVAAARMVDAVLTGKSLFAFGASHSFILAEELVYRTGGLMLFNPIYPHGMNLFVRPATATSRMERVVGLGEALLDGSPAKEGDILLIASTSGRNAVAIDMALAARQRGIFTIGITSFDYTNAVASRHPSGKKVAEIVNVVLDNCAPYGDASVEIEGSPKKAGPLSSVTGCALVNAIVCEVVAMLCDRGVEPPVFQSANVDGGGEYNARLLEANRDRIHYMD